MQPISVAAPARRRWPAALRVLLPVLGIGLAAPAWAEAPGWQPISEFTPAAGQSTLEYTYPCGGSYPIAVSGGFETNANVGQESQTILTANGPRFDEGSKTAFKAWAWHFFWPNGAPEGIKIKFSVYCAKK